MQNSKQLYAKKLRIQSVSEQAMNMTVIDHEYDASDYQTFISVGSKNTAT